MMSMQWIVFVILMLVWSNERRIAAEDLSSSMSPENETTVTVQTTPFMTTAKMSETYNTATTEYPETADNSTTTEAPGKNLPLILGLSLGLGLGVPATVAAVGGAVYYFKVYRPKHNQILVKGH